MVQVDVFWAYGIGAGFAVAAAHQIGRRAALSAKGTAQGIAEAIAESTTKGTAKGTTKGMAADAEEGPGALLANPYLCGAVLFCAAVFAPSGVWLLWGFPSWETMQVGDASMPAWLVAAFAATNTTQGLVGFLVTQWLIRRGHVRWALLQMMAGYFGMFFILVHGWDGRGYQRFFSRDKAGFEHWALRSGPEHVRDWLTSPVALTLYGMGVVMIPLMLTVMSRFHQQGLDEAGVDGPGPLAVTGLVLGSVGAALVAALTAGALVHLTGWIAGPLIAAVLLWALVVRRGALVSLLARSLALPPDTPAAAPAHPPQPSAG
ncbi:hypothetical protein [Wenjunlia tyrosinilytica]|uniref:Uncharacterized protein n=1 Tax=Wenjunlia tyrosinilytica TaxID=1544741 RepID=A0A917ZQQ2_9ACTN|nr:hypothetical protein [Wenjunlia tyrosinilytica]GGO89925.1 hypothetical protein GCM10012280_34260 [Wenjunlia tyrosinilytica]